MSRPPFSLLRACFYLFGIVILIAMIETLLAVTACSWMIVIQLRDPVTGCANFASQVRDLITELIAGILALLVAARPPGPPPSGPPEG